MVMEYISKIKSGRIFHKSNQMTVTENRKLICAINNITANITNLLSTFEIPVNYQTININNLLNQI